MKKVLEEACTVLNYQGIDTVVDGDDMLVSMNNYLRKITTYVSTFRKPM